MKKLLSGRTTSCWFVLRLALPKSWRNGKARNRQRSKGYPVQLGGAAVQLTQLTLARTSQRSLTSRLELRVRCLSSRNSPSLPPVDHHETIQLLIPKLPMETG